MSISVARSLWSKTALVAVDEFNQRFPDLSWGTYNGHHPTKDRASDGMVPRWDTAAGKARGWVVAKWVRANAVRLRVWYVIFDGKIWSRTYPERGWATYTPTAAAVKASRASAYHYNHVHVSFYDMEPATPPKPVEYLPPYVVDPLKVSTTLWAVHPTKEDVERPPLFRISTAVRIKEVDGRKWLETEAGYLYDLDFVVPEAEYKARPAPVIEPKPIPPEAGPPVPAVVADEPEPNPDVPVLVKELDAPGAGNWQGAVQNIETGEWFIGHARARTDGGEDAVFYRFDKDGKYVDKVELLGGEHPTAFGVSESNIIWASHNGPRSPGGQPVNDVVTFRWQPNKQLTKADCQVMHVFTDEPAHISFSPTRGWGVVRERTKDASGRRVDNFRRYAKQDILDNVDSQRGKTITIPRTDPATQGFTCIEDRLYVFRGAANEKTWIEVWSFGTGKKLRQYDVTEVGLYEGEIEALRPAVEVRNAAFLPADQAKLMREAEGLDGRYMCVKVSQGPMRKLRIYEMPAKWREA